MQQATTQCPQSESVFFEPGAATLPVVVASDGRDEGGRAITGAFLRRCCLPLPEAFDYFRSFHRSLGIVLTLRCPLECAHCGVSSGPARNEAVGGDWLVSSIREAGPKQRLRLLMITGGEPFLEPTRLKAILREAAEFGIQASVDTSAHWASGLIHARRFLEKFPGLTHLNVSADAFHEPFVPLGHVRNALLAALEQGIHPSLMVRVFDQSGDPFLERLYRGLGEPLLRRVSLDLAGIGPVGRAAELAVPPAAQRRPSRAFPAGACDFAHQPLVTHDGTLLVCCNQRVARKYKPLQLGNLEDTSLEELTRAAHENLLLQALRVWGPRELAEWLVADGLGGRLQGSYRGNDLCSLCEDVVSQPDLVAHLRARLQASAGELALGRALRYVEVSA